MDAKGGQGAREALHARLDKGLRKGKRGVFDNPELRTKEVEMRVA